LQKKYKEEVIKKHDEYFNYEEEPIDGRVIYDSGGGNAHGLWDQCITSLTLLVGDTIPLTTIDYFFWKVCSVRWGAGLQGGNAAEAKFIIHVFWSYTSCISDTFKLWGDGKWHQNDERCAGGGTRKPQSNMRVSEYLQRTDTSVLDGKK
jgi:hypothetical protein